MDEVLDCDIYLEDCRLKAATKIVEASLNAQVYGGVLTEKSNELLSQASTYLIEMFKAGTKECQSLERK